MEDHNKIPEGNSAQDPNAIGRFCTRCGDSLADCNCESGKALDIFLRPPQLPVGVTFRGTPHPGSRNWSERYAKENGKKTFTPPDHNVNRDIATQIL